MSRLKRGDHVEWNTSQGPARGIVVRTVATPVQVKGHTAEASRDKPQVEVRASSNGCAR